MSDYRNSQADGALPGGSTAGGSARYQFVRLPERTDGIGTALRRAFAPCAKAVQDEFNALLSRIDQATKTDQAGKIDRGKTDRG